MFLIIKALAAKIPVNDIYYSYLLIKNQLRKGKIPVKKSQKQKIPELYGFSLNFPKSNRKTKFEYQSSSYKQDTEFITLCSVNKAREMYLFTF